MLDAIIAQHRDYDLIIATGDLAQITLSKPISILLRASHVCPGPASGCPVITIFSLRCSTRWQPLISMPTSRCWWVSNGRLCCWTASSGVPHGMLSDYQLEWLDNALARYPQRHTLVLLHHHPLASGCTARSAQPAQLTSARCGVTALPVSPDAGLWSYSP